MGVLTRDSVKNDIFTMRVVLIWTMNDLPAYGMASGWSTIGVMGCLVSMEDTHAFYLQNGRKARYFDYHKQFLRSDHPYHRNKKAFTKNESREEGCTSKIDGRTDPRLG
ncbi:UNVERIFIED_CONTAM: hypothetical protein Sradi_0474100 [Sesamum radiatum]|uniref:Uncharacterized protein n=1 Tax=Sesamum radiatum TaxID=300843 RepID=A0AAW2W7W4_SESRA